MVMMIEGPATSGAAGSIPPRFGEGDPVRIDWPRSVDNGRVCVVHRDVVVIRPDGSTRRVPRNRLTPVY